ncbi:Quercetin 2,3-dioxygenase [Planctomycetes bacterium MalM25]|nr:Quercetin 2,3-dioxygenase [Planctomycetes bacterium MalM25]
MIRIRNANDRGHANHGWLNSHHTFSFADYQDPAHQRFRSLRVMNEDRVAPGQGFGTHPHRDMEIVSYVLAGALEHKDSMGNGEVLRPGEFQRISAGTGVLHSEFNPSSTEPVHFYQIWLLPERKGIEPSYEQKQFDEAERINRFRLVASPNGAEGSLSIHQDARVYLSTLEAGAEVSHQLASDRHAWLQVLKGTVNLADRALTAGDGVAVSDEPLPPIHAGTNAEVLLFDLA